MERPSTLMDQHCENGHTSKSNLHVQGNPYQNSNDILHKNRKNNLEIIINTKDLE
jgi:hypothetical protein